MTEFIESAPECLAGIFDNCETLESCKMYVLYELDAFTDEPIEEREHHNIKTQRQYNQVKKWFGGHAK